MILRSLFLVLTLWWVAVPAAAQADEIQSTIKGQIEAFQADDFDRAFSFASPTIKTVFGNASNFRRMVIGGYPMVYRPKSIRFGELANERGVFVQSVYIEDQAGRLFEASYEMIQTDNGWKINGVYIAASQELDA